MKITKLAILLLLIPLVSGAYTVDLYVSEGSDNGSEGAYVVELQVTGLPAGNFGEGGYYVDLGADLNNAPIISDVTIIPSDPDQDQSMNCSWNFSDTDSNVSTFSNDVTWFINGDPMTSNDTTVTCTNNAICYTDNLTGTYGRGTDVVCQVSGQDSDFELAQGNSSAVNIRYTGSSSTGGVALVEPVLFTISPVEIVNGTERIKPAILFNPSGNSTTYNITSLVSYPITVHLKKDGQFYRLSSGRSVLSYDFMDVPELVVIPAMKTVSFTVTAMLPPDALGEYKAYILPWSSNTEMQIDVTMTYEDVDEDERHWVWKPIKTFNIRGKEISLTPGVIAGMIVFMLFAYLVLSNLDFLTGGEEKG